MECNMKKISLQKGFSLIELMIAVAIIAIIAAVGMPAYNGYITTSREGVLVNNLSTIEVFQEDFRLRNGNFLVAAANLAAITAGIGWAPQDDGGVTYVITDPGGGSYDITATDAGGTTVCMTMPEKVRC
jgi:type IV pilus assembly protein PilE